MHYLTPQQLKAVNTKGHLAITANAGSGKTYVFAHRYLSIALEQEPDLSKIAAITFTEKAASELYSKISNLIDENLLLETNEEKRKKLEKIRRQLVSANISTIHSFCVNILRDFPVEANIDARFTPIDEALSDELIELSVQEVVKNGFNDELISEKLKYLYRIFGSKSRLENELKSLFKKRKNLISVSKNIYSKTDAEIDKYLNEQFNAYFKIIWEKLSEEFIRSFQHVNDKVLLKDDKNELAILSKLLTENLKSAVNTDEILNLLSEIKENYFTKSGGLIKRGYTQKVLKDEPELNSEIEKINVIISELNDFFEINFHKSDNQSFIQFGKNIYEIFDYCLVQYEKKKRDNAFIDYEDILIYTQELLTHSNVLESLQKKFSFIMVDEFQDTNEIQYEIFIPILDYLRGGNLFIVGDEKQSIYKFRDAEIEIFNQTKTEIVNNSGDENLIILPESFRMQPELCAFTNYLFNNLFGEADNNFGEVSNNELICARTSDGKGIIEIIIGDSDKENEAKIVSNKIISLNKKEKINWEDIAVLVRKRKSFESLEKEFVKKKIPFTIVGGRGFYQKQLISDIYNYLSFLADENNNVALAGLLRSPFFFIADSELFEISLHKGVSFWQKLKNYSHDNLKFKDTISILEENLKLSGSLELTALLKKILSEGSFLSVYSNHPDGVQEISNIDKLIKISRQFNDRGFRNLYDFVDFLKNSILNTVDESQATIITDNNAVKVMTVHQAKGLEFPVVFLYKCEDIGLPVSVKSRSIVVSKNFGIITKLPLNEDYFEEYSISPITAVYNYLEEKKNTAEVKRLLYVAVTRAKDRLYISGSKKEGRDFPAKSFLGLISTGLATNFISNEILINQSVSLLKINESSFNRENQTLNLEIPIIKNAEELFETADETFKQVNYDKLLPFPILTKEKGEIISATKVSVYSQCPLKYFLIYEAGFGFLNSHLLSMKSNLKKNETGFEQVTVNNENDDGLQEQITSKADLRGRIVHKVLEKEGSADTLYSDLQDAISDLVNEEERTEVKEEEIKHLISNYYSSKIYKRIKSFEDYKNEFEIYLAEKDYFIYGIIDKLIIEGDKIIIIDYKTDILEEKEMAERFLDYAAQLKFYLYISSKLFKDFKFFRGQIVFLQLPDKEFSLDYTKNEIKLLHSEIEKFIDGMRNKEKLKNLEHCKNCAFSYYSGKCIVK